MWKTLSEKNAWKVSNGSICQVFRVVLDTYKQNGNYPINLYVSLLTYDNWHAYISTVSLERSEISFSIRQSIMLHNAWSMASFQSDLNLKQQANQKKKWWKFQQQNGGDWGQRVKKSLSKGVA